MALKRNSNDSSKRRTSGQTTSGRINYQELEGRRMLATFFVDTIADSSSGVEDGLVSLREAVIAANTNSAFGDAEAGDADGDRIQFDPSIAGQTITLTLGQISISDDVLIQGGARDITIAGNGNTRLFEVASTERVGFSRLTLTDGNAGIGGAITSIGSGTTLMSQIDFQDNQATGAGGGAAYVANGNLFLINSTLTGNSAVGTDGAGGAVYAASGFVYSNGSTYTTNTANRSGGAIELINGDYFGINNDIGTTTAGNTAGLVGSANPGNGGGIHIGGTATASLVGDSVVNNFAAADGGGVWVGSGGSVFLRTNGAISNNEAAGGNPGNGGGGVYLDGGAFYVLSSEISNNTASGTFSSGGGILSDAGRINMNVSEVVGNSAARFGGGIQISDAFMRLNNTQVTQNDVGTTVASTEGFGGGINADDGAIILMSQGQVGDNAAISQGGGIWAGVDTSLFLSNSASVSFNQLSGSDSIGGGIYTQGYLQALDSFFQRNSSESVGGGVQITNVARARIDASTFLENESGTLGGGVFNNGFMYVTDTVFRGNSVSANGGGYFTTGTATTISSGLTFSENTPNNRN